MHTSICVTDSWRNHLRRFFVDVVASLPMTYIALIVAAVEGKEVTQDKGSRILKATRIIRLAKMLRVARLKRIVGRHASLVEFTAYVNSLFTFIAILYVAHLVACCWYLVGTISEESWVFKGLEQPVYSGTYSYKYSMSLYTIFKLGEGICYTSEEAVFAFLSELTISLIYGALAGVMSTMMMARAARTESWATAGYPGLSRRPSLRQVESSRLVFAAPISSPGPTGPALSNATAVCSSGNGS